MSQLFRIQQIYDPQLRFQNNDKTRIDLLLAYATDVKQLDLTKAIQLCEEAYHLAVPLFDKKRMALSLKLMGECQYKIGSCAIAILKLSDALELYTDLGDYEGLAFTHRYTGVSYAKLGYYTMSIEHHMKSYEFSKKLKTSFFRASTLNDLAMVYAQIREFEKAIKCFKECELIHLESNDLLALGQTYNNMGFSYFNQNKYSDALQVYIKAVGLFRQVDSLRDLGIGLNNIGAAYGGLNQNDEALPYLKESLQVREKVKDRWGIASTCINIGENYFKQKKYDTGIEYLRRAMPICEELNAKRMLIPSHLLFISFYKANGNQERLLYHRQKLEQVEKEMADEKEQNRMRNISMGEDLEKALILKKKKQD